MGIASLHPAEKVRNPRFGAGLPFLLPQILEFQSFRASRVYHYTQKDYRTELYYFRIIFGNSCSVITEPICFRN